MQIQISIPLHFFNIVRIKLSLLCKFKLQRYLASQRQRKVVLSLAAVTLRVFQDTIHCFDSTLWVFHDQSIFSAKRSRIFQWSSSQWISDTQWGVTSAMAAFPAFSHWQLSTMSICLCQISAMKRIVMDGYYSRCTKKSKPLNCPCAPWPWPIALVDHNIAHVRIPSLIHTTQAMSKDRSHSVFPTCKCVW